MVQSDVTILFSFLSDIDEISVVFEIIMESCAYGEKSCEFEHEKSMLSGLTISSRIFVKLVS
jgi:hypothetical protein